MLVKVSNVYTLNLTDTFHSLVFYPNFEWTYVWWSNSYRSQGRRYVR